MEKKKSQQIKKILFITNEHVLKQLDEDITSIDNEIRHLKQAIERDTSLDDFKLSTHVFFRNPKDYWLKASATEKKVLLAWSKLIQREDPDIIIGYN